MTPPLLIVNPTGSDPLLTEKFFAPLPPETAIVAPAYFAPVVPAARVAGEALKLRGGLTVIVTACVFDGSATLATVTVAVVDELTTGAVYVTDGELPLARAALKVPPPASANVAPAPLLSPVTDALIATVCVPSPSSATALGDVSAIAIGVRVTAAVAVLVGSVLLVAVTVVVAAVTAIGAVNNPVGVIVPADAVHATP
jgi:hypothetical protein